MIRGALSAAISDAKHVEHLGWDTIPPQHAARHGFPLATFQLRFAEWWQTLLQTLTEIATHPPIHPPTTTPDI